jgi:hypothetical protein
VPKAQITIPYKQLGHEHGLQEGGDTSSGLWARKPFLVAWKDRYLFAQQMLGGSRQSGGLLGEWVQTPPMTYLWGGQPNLYARSFTIDPDRGAFTTTSDPTIGIAYQNAIVTVEFRQPDWNVTLNDDPGFFNSISQDPGENASLLWARQELDFNREVYSIPGGTLWFKSDGAKAADQKKLSVGVTDMVITWDRLPYLPMGKVVDYVDSVNDATFLGKLKGTVFFAGVKTVREVDVYGRVMQKVQMHLKWRFWDWNQFLRSDGARFDFISTTDPATTYTPLYPYKNFKQLLL